MVNLYPPRKYWPWILLGFVIVVAVNLILLVPFLGTIVASLLVTLIIGRRKFLRTFLAFFFWIGGFELVLLGILLILGFGLIPVFSAAASAFFMTSGPLLGVIFIVIGIIAFVIGNLVSE